MNQLSEQIIDALDIHQVVQAYGYTPSQSGFLRCPFHAGDHTASLKLYGDGRGWYCFGCGRGGTVIDFVMHLFGIGYMPACTRINEDFALSLPVGRMTHKEKQEARQQMRRRKAEQDARNAVIRAAQDRYQSALERYAAADLAIVQNEPLSNEWCAGQSDILQAAAELETAEQEVRQLEQHKRTYSAAGVDGG